VRSSSSCCGRLDLAVLLSLSLSVLPRADVCLVRTDLSFRQAPVVRVDSLSRGVTMASMPEKRVADFSQICSVFGVPMSPLRSMLIDATMPRDGAEPRAARAAARALLLETRDNATVPRERECARGVGVCRYSGQYCGVEMVALVAVAVAYPLAGH